MDGKGKRLVERFALSSAISLGTLTWQREIRPSSAMLLCAADPTGTGEGKAQSIARVGFAPLPFARKEGRQIVRLFPGGGTLQLFGSEAQAAQVKRRMGRYAILHFATHGVLEMGDGMRSGLTLADKDAEGGVTVLEAREIAGMKLSAKLAVLSACDTGQGQKSGGEGLLGLTWAFLAAGCPSVVASQWSVDDEATGQLMVAFYKQLKAGVRKDAALRQAMLQVKKAKPSPYYWAAFEVVGETNAVHIPAQKAP